MYAEITKETFYNLVNENLKCSSVKEEEHAVKTYYNIGDTNLLTIVNYVSCTTQYYIKDINA